MKNIIKVSLATCLMIAFSGCAEKNKSDNVLTTLNFAQKESFFHVKITPKELKEFKSCPEKKILSEHNLMGEKSFLVYGATPERYEKKDVGIAIKTEGCLEKDKENNDTIVIDVVYKENYIKN